MKRRTLLTAVPAAVLLAACGDRATDLFQRRVYTFGSWVDLSFFGVAPAKAERVAARLEAELSFMNQAWHAWKPSVVEDVNARLRAGTPFPAPEAVLPLITQCKTLYRQSDGLFNPAMGRLIRRWGFHSDKSWEDREPPSPAEIAALLAHEPTMDDVELDGTTLVGHNDQISLDFGGFAKGYGLNQLAAILRQEGVPNALVSATSSIVALGRHGDRPWRVAIRHPRQEGAVLAWLELGDGESVSTSGDYERYFIHQGRRYHHIIDPRTGYPATGAQAVTALYREGVVPDAGSTALMVAGPTGFARISRQLGLDAALMVDAEGRLLITEALRPRLHFPGNQPPPEREIPA